MGMVTEHRHTCTVWSEVFMSALATDHLSGGSIWVGKEEMQVGPGCSVWTLKEEQPKTLTSSLSPWEHSTVSLSSRLNFFRKIFTLGAFGVAMNINRQNSPRLSYYTALCTIESPLKSARYLVWKPWKCREIGVWSSIILVGLKRKGMFIRVQGWASSVLLLVVTEEP